MEHSTSAVNWQPRNRAKAPGETAPQQPVSTSPAAPTRCCSSSGGRRGPGRRSSTPRWCRTPAPTPGLARGRRAAARRSTRLGEVGRQHARARGGHPLRLGGAGGPASWTRTPASTCATSTAPQALHRALSAPGVAVDIVHPDADLSGYRLVLVPTLYLVTDAAAAPLAAAVEARRPPSLVTYFSGIVDEHDHIRLGGYPGAFRDLLGVRVEEFFPLLPASGAASRARRRRAHRRRLDRGPAAWPAPRRSRRTPTGPPPGRPRSPGAPVGDGRRLVRRHAASTRRHRPRWSRGCSPRPASSRWPGAAGRASRSTRRVGDDGELAVRAQPHRRRRPRSTRTGTTWSPAATVAGDLTVPAAASPCVTGGADVLAAAAPGRDPRRARAGRHRPGHRPGRAARRLRHDDPPRPRARSHERGPAREGARRGGRPGRAEHRRARLRGEVGPAAGREGGHRRARPPSWCSPASAIAVSAGTTTYALARHLARHPRPDRRHQLGPGRRRAAPHGRRRPHRCCSPAACARRPTRWSGPVAVAALRSLHVDAVFLGVHGMDARAGFTTPNLLEAETNRAMIAASRRLVVCADSTKWGVVGLSSMAALSEAAVLVTDAGLSPTPRHARRARRRAGGRRPARPRSTTSSPRGPERGDVHLARGPGSGGARRRRRRCPGVVLGADLGDLDDGALAALVAARATRHTALLPSTARDVRAWSRPPPSLLRHPGPAG